MSKSGPSWMLIRGDQEKQVGRTMGEMIQENTPEKKKCLVYLSATNGLTIKPNLEWKIRSCYLSAAGSSSNCSTVPSIPIHFLSPSLFTLHSSLPLLLLTPPPSSSSHSHHQSHQHKPYLRISSCEVHPACHIVSLFGTFVNTVRNIELLCKHGSVSEA